jgi:hypothetical protein
MYLNMRYTNEKVKIRIVFVDKPVQVTAKVERFMATEAL